MRPFGKSCAPPKKPVVRSPDVAGPAVDAGPFDLPGGGSGAALCLHGLTGTPYEVRPLAEALARAGVRAVGPELPGHGGDAAACRWTPHEAWVASARREARALRQAHAPVFGLGLSMGGLVTLLLAAEGLYDAVVCVGVPIRLRQPGVGLVRFLKYLVPAIPKKAGSDICDPAARARHPSLPTMPLASIHELQKLQARVREALPRVVIPLLVAYGGLDSTAHPGDARAIADGVGSRVVEQRIYERSAHIVPVDRDGPALAEAVVGFLADPESAAQS